MGPVEPSASLERTALRLLQRHGPMGPAQACRDARRGPGGCGLLRLHERHVYLGRAVQDPLRGLDCGAQGRRPDPPHRVHAPLRPEPRQPDQPETPLHGPLQTGAMARPLVPVEGQAAHHGLSRYPRRCARRPGRNGAPTGDPGVLHLPPGPARLRRRPAARRPVGMARELPPARLCQAPGRRIRTGHRRCGPERRRHQRRPLLRVQPARQLRPKLHQTAGA